MKNLFMISVLALAAGTAMAQEAVGTALNKCAAISDAADRLSCYDALAAVLSPVGDQGAAYVPASRAEPAAAQTTAGVAAATTAVATSQTGAVPLNDDVGKERVQAASEQERTRYASHVTKCEESQPSGQTYFFMDNGQVWKQAKYRRLNFKDCDFEVEITKGTFGYEMHIPSKDRNIRISRIR